MQSAVLAVLVFVLPLHGQDWGALSSLRPGDSVKVLDAKNKEHRGSLAEVSQDSIRLSEANGVTGIPRAEVRRVQVRSGAHRARNIAIGAAVGIAVGALADQTLGAYLRNESSESGGARAVTYVVPIGIFAALGATLPAYRTIYRVR